MFYGSTIVAITVLSALSATLVTSILKILHYRKLVDNKNIELIKSYLGMRMMKKLFLYDFHGSDLNDFYDQFTEIFKEYYGFEDIFTTYSSKGFLGINRNITDDKIILINYLTDNIEKIEHQYNKDGIAKIDFKNQDVEYQIYVSLLKVSLSQNNHMIICVAKKPLKFNLHEGLNMENCLSLLKSRLSHHNSINNSDNLG